MSARYGEPSVKTDAARVIAVALFSLALWPLFILKGLDISNSEPAQPEFQDSFAAIVATGHQEGLEASIRLKLKDPQSADNLALELSSSFKAAAAPKEKVFLLTAGLPSTARCTGPPSNVIHEDAELSAIPASAQVVASKYAENELLRKQPGAEPGASAVSALASSLRYTVRTFEVEDYYQDPEEKAALKGFHLEASCYSGSDPWAPRTAGQFTYSMPTLITYNYADSEALKVDSEGLSCSQSVELGPGYSISSSDPAVTSQRLIGRDCGYRATGGDYRYISGGPAALVLQQQRAQVDAQRELFRSGVALGIFGGLVVWAFDPVCRLLWTAWQWRRASRANISS